MRKMALRLLVGSARQRCAEGAHLELTGESMLPFSITIEIRASRRAEEHMFLTRNYITWTLKFRTVTPLRMSYC